MPNPVNLINKKLGLRLLLTCAVLFPSLVPADVARLADAVQELNAPSFTKKAEAVRQLSAIDDERVIDVLQAMLEGRLYRHAEDNHIVAMSEDGGIHSALDVLTGETRSDIERGTYKKIGINNTLRVQLRGTIARLSLDSKNSQVRLRAVRAMMKGLDAEGVTLLRNLRQREKSAEVREALEVAIALSDVTSDTPAVRLAAIDVLGESLYPEARAALLSLASFNRGTESATAVHAALQRIEGKLKLMETAKTVFFGLSLGSVLLLSAIGLAITFGVMGVINMAHGELMMLGAYTTYIVQQLMPGALDYSLLVAVPAAFLVSGAFGVAIERGVIRFLYGRPLETLLATFGISLILQQLVRATISAQNVTVANPSWMSGSLQLNNALSLTYNRVYILLFALAVFVALLLILKKTALGLHVRAVSHNRGMARAMGIRSSWVDAMTFGLGSGIAGIAGVALSQLTNVGPNMGQAYIIDSFMVVVFGGVGNLWGTLVGAFSLGIANKLLEPWAGAVLAKILVLVAIILFIQKRPRGLFPQKGRAAEG